MVIQILYWSYAEVYQLVNQLKTMEFIKGNKIQAVDENGHWCSGIVENVLDGKEQYEIGFKGWSKEFNRIVSTKEIRPSILPAEEQIRGKLLYEM